MRLLLLLALALPLAAQERNYARSMVISDRGIVATSQTLASQAGAQILARGGSAIDAAIAANATLGVVEPMMNGVGGDLFAIYWDAATGKLTGLNASGWAPTGLTIQFLKSLGNDTMPQRGIQSVTVPGAVDGWAKLHGRFGKLPWAELFQPAIYYAENGYPLTELIQEDWQLNVGKLSGDENARRFFLPGGSAPKLGAMFRNPQMAAAYRTIATEGPQAVYRGPIAQAILKTSARLGGKMTAADLSEYSAEWVQPVSAEYRGWRVYEMPPNSQGIAVLEMLNLFAQFPLHEYFSRSADELHIQIEAQKLAYADLQRYVADPKFAKVPVDGMLSVSYARDRAKGINPAMANCEAAPGKPLPATGDTIYLSVVDRQGNIVSLIQSLFSDFGSGVGVDGYGFLLHNRGGLFTLDAGHPNALAPRKRPFHTIIPGFMEKGNLHIGFGIMGGLNQAQAHAQFVSNVVDQEMNIQAALEAPRFRKVTQTGCEVSLENRISPEVRDTLSARGHVLRVLGDYDTGVGGGQAVMYDTAAKVKYGASDPRKDGAAVPEPPPYFASPAASARR